MENVSVEDHEAFANLTFSTHQFIAPRDCSFEKEYIIDESNLIGTGGFGKVYRCIHRASGQVRAAKRIPKRETKKDRKAIQREFQILAQLDHPNLLKTYDLLEDEDYYIIVTDLYQGGDLFDLVGERGPLTETEVAVVMQRVLGAIHYCHEKKIAHRDLKLENVLLQGADLHNLKIIDFGFAKQFQDDKPMDEVIGSPSYISPQIIDGEYNHKVDIWAIGVMAYVLLSGDLPFGTATDPQTIHNIQSGTVSFEQEEFQDVSPLCLSFVRELLTMAEDERPTAKEALRHGWLKQYSTTPKQSRKSGGSKNGVSSESSSASLSTTKEIKDALKCFQKFGNKCCKLKQAVAVVLASQFLPQDEGVDAIFRALDRENNGYLRAEDIQWAFERYLGVKGTLEDLQELMFQINFSGSGTFCYSEFMAILALEGSNGEKARDLVEMAFHYFDTENNGYITSLDLERGLPLDSSPWAAEYASRMMIAEVTQLKVIPKEVFGKVLVGKRASARSSGKGLKRFEENIDYCQAQANAWAKNMGKIVDNLLTSK